MDLNKGGEKLVESKLWYHCAGREIDQMPQVNTKVVYFPQGHCQNANIQPRIEDGYRFPKGILSKVSYIKYLVHADDETDEVYVNLGLVPLQQNDAASASASASVSAYAYETDDDDYDINDHSVQSNFSQKTLTQSDANNGGGFSVPKSCADTIFPKLDYSAEPPTQKFFPKDVHGEKFEFKHIYRGTPRRHLLTTGWSTFINRKKLSAGDHVIFLKEGNGDISIGTRREKKPSRISETEENSKIQSITETLRLAARGQPFEVTYYPRAKTPKFVVNASSVSNAMSISWHPGMRFKSCAEIINLFGISPSTLGTISTVQVLDPNNWPQSPWGLLQVVFDENLDSPRNDEAVNPRVNPWSIEPVVNIPNLNDIRPPPPPRRKKPRSEFPFIDRQLRLTNISLSDNNSNRNISPPAGGIQEAGNHFQFEYLSSESSFNNSEFRFYLNESQSQSQSQHQDQNQIASLPQPPPPPAAVRIQGNSSQLEENNSSGLETTTSPKKEGHTVYLFGQPIGHSSS